jgi:hypothetical protein
VLPTRQRQLVASNIAHPRPLDFHLTGMEELGLLISHDYFR